MTIGRMVLPLAAALVVAGGLSAQDTQLAEGEVFRRPFSAIAGLRELSDGTVLVSDPLEEVLVRVGPEDEGRTMGRTGQGPGEYLGPDVLLPLAADSTLLFDSRLARYLVLDPSGTPVHTFDLRRSAPFIATQRPRGIDDRGGLYIREADGGNISFGQGGPESNRRVWRFDRTNGETEAITALSTVAGRDMPVGVPFKTEHGMTQMLIIIPSPFAAADGWGLAPNGTVAALRAADDLVEWIASDGTTSTDPLPGLGASRVTSDDRERFMAWWVETEMEGMDQDGIDLPEFEYPEHKPTFAAGFHLTAPDGTLWIRTTHESAELQRYQLVTGNHAALELQLAAGERVVGFGAQSVYVARTDDLGLQWLSRHPLPGGNALMGG